MAARAKKTHETLHDFEIIFFSFQNHTTLIKHQKICDLYRVNITQHNIIFNLNIFAHNRKEIKPSICARSQSALYCGVKLTLHEDLNQSSPDTGRTRLLRKGLCTVYTY